MNRRLPAAFTAGLLLWCAAFGQAAEVSDAPRTGDTIESCLFPSKSLPQPFRPPRRFKDGYALFQAAGPFLSEEVTVKSVVLLGRDKIHLTEKEVQGLGAGLDRVYGKIAGDALFKNIHSVLPYCLADKRPSQGHYFAYFPEKVTDTTPVIVFLHGFGGNFLFYAYLLKEEFPNAVILLPTWGASWHDGTIQYLDDMYKDVTRRKAFAIRTPHLMAISAGGPAGFRIYNDAPERFFCYVSIVSAPSCNIVPVLKRDLKILMINGRHDSGLPIRQVESLGRQLADQIPHFELSVVDGDHYFLLTKREEAFRVVKRFLKKVTDPQSESPARP